MQRLQHKGSIPVTSELQACFFSYARSDGEVVLRLARELRAAGADVWIDQLDIVGGERWDQAVEAALRRCHGVIVVLSPASVISNNVMDEVSYALDERKPVIPVLLSDCEIPLRLRRFQHVDYRSDHAAGFAALLRALASNVNAAEAAEPKVPVPELVPTRAPASDVGEGEVATSQHGQADKKRKKLWVGLGATVAVVVVGLMISQQIGESSRLRGETQRVQRKADVAETARKAEAGDPFALNDLADLYRQGIDGMPKDVPKAVTLYRRAVEKVPHSLALLSLAFIYMHGEEGVDPDPVSALMWSYLNGDRTSEKSQAHADVRDLENRLTADQIAEARSRADAWYKTHYSSFNK